MASLKDGLAASRPSASGSSGLRPPPGPSVLPTREQPYLAPQAGRDGPLPYAQTEQ